MERKFISTFCNKIIWITGASSGIGEALAVELSKLGSKLILSARNMAELERVKKDCYKSQSIELIKLDMELPDSIPAIALRVIQQSGPIDFLFNVAGVAARETALKTELHIDQKIMNINYFGPITLTKAVLPSMIERKNGHIITVTSVAGKYGLPMLSAYAASKHALHGFFDSILSEICNKNIHITLIVPGAVNTPITRHALTGKGENFGKMLQVQKDGISAECCAQRILKAVVNCRQEKIIGGIEENATLFVKRFFPGYFSKFISNHPLKKWRKVKNSLRLKW